ncbi:hypothetical protein BC938DRAFT_470746, partial [Jimgerdemannia flammicorona]
MKFSLFDILALAPVLFFVTLGNCQGDGSTSIEQYPSAPDSNWPPQDSSSFTDNSDGGVFKRGNDYSNATIDNQIESHRKYRKQFPLALRDYFGLPLTSPGPRVPYKGGNVLNQRVNLYYILYGDDWTCEQQNLLKYHGKYISGTSWWNITQLPNAQNQRAGGGHLIVKAVVNKRTCPPPSEHTHPRPPPSKHTQYTHTRPPPSE